MPLRDVSKDEYRAYYLAARDDGSCAVVDWSASSITGDELSMVCKPLYRAFTKRTKCGVLDGCFGFLVDNSEHLFKRCSARVFLRPTGKTLGDSIQEGDIAVRVCRYNRIADTCECLFSDDSQPLFVPRSLGAYPLPS
jgi:hypothetical protein